MVRSIIHHQNHPSSRVLLHQQFFKKVDESSAVLGFRCSPGDGVFLPVVTTKDVSLLFFSWSGRWNTSLLPNLPPARSQRWTQRYGRFVHKDELEIVSEDLFFNASNLSAASVLASLSCKWPRSCFEQQYRYPFRLSKARNRLSFRFMPVFFSRWARKRSIVQMVKSYPNLKGSFSIISNKAKPYSSSDFSGRPLLGRLANPSIPPLCQRSIKPSMVGLLAACISAICSGLCPKMKEAN